MSGFPGKEKLTEGEATGMDDAVRTPIEHPPVEERRTDDGEQRHEKVNQAPQQDDYQHWVESQQEAYQQAEPRSSSSGGGRRSPKDRDVGEGPSQDPELSSLSALSNFSTGLSVSSNLRFHNFISSVVDHVQVDSDADSALGDLGSP